MQLELKWQHFLESRNQRFQEKLLRDAIKNYLVRPGTVLDISAGDAPTLPWLKEAGHTVYTVQGAKKLAFPDNAFDHLICRNLLGTLTPTESDRILKEMLRVTRDIVLFYEHGRELKEFTGFLTKDRPLELLEVFKAGWYPPRSVLAVLQKTPLLPPPEEHGGREKGK